MQYPDQIVIREIEEEDNKILIELDVAQEDKSRVIGKKGKCCYEGRF